MRSREFFPARRKRQSLAVGHTSLFVCRLNTTTIKISFKFTVYNEFIINIHVSNRIRTCDFNARFFLYCACAHNFIPSPLLASESYQGENECYADIPPNYYYNWVGVKLSPDTHNRMEQWWTDNWLDKTEVPANNFSPVSFNSPQLLHVLSRSNMGPPRLKASG
jgi:hypothetical protein